MKSVFAKVFADHLSEKCGYKHNKGLLLDHFLRHKPAYVSGIIAFDDHKDVIADISNFKAVKYLDDETKCSVLEEDFVSVIPITIIPVTSDKLSCEYYALRIEEHLNMAI